MKFFFFFEISYCNCYFFGLYGCCLVLAQPAIPMESLVFALMHYRFYMLFDDKTFPLAGYALSMSDIQLRF